MDSWTDGFLYWWNPLLMDFFTDVLFNLWTSYIVCRITSLIPSHDHVWVPQLRSLKPYHPSKNSLRNFPIPLLSAGRDAFVPCNSKCFTLLLHYYTFLHPFISASNNSTNIPLHKIHLACFASITLPFLAMVTGVLETFMVQWHLNVYTPMHSHMYTYSHTHVHTYTHTYIDTYTHAHTHKHTQKHTHSCTHTYEYVHIHARAQTHICMRHLHRK